LLRQTFQAPYDGKASDLFLRMQEASPSPYEFLIQFGDEQLVGRVAGNVRTDRRGPRRNLPYLRHGAPERATRSAMRRISASCSIRPKKNPS